MTENGRTALLTGAASPRGIGRATADRLAREGWAIAVLDIDADEARAAAAQIGEAHGVPALGVGADVSDSGAVDAAIAEVEAGLPPIVGLANLAGIASPVPFMNETVEGWDRVFAINMRGTFIVTQRVMRGMIERKRGRVVSVSSVSAQRGGGTYSKVAYSASKAGIIGFTRALAREVGEHGITVNAVAPGPIDTDIMGGTLTEERKAAMSADTLLGRVGTPEEVAALIAFLLGDDAGWITAATYDINGGLQIFMNVTESELLASYPPETEIPASEVAASVAASGRTLVVLDDDPTGTQSVADLPVLTRWASADFEWAFAQHAPAVYVLTNTRSLDPDEAAKRNREVVRNALAAAREVPLAFVSRSDSTLRGHFPLEPEVIADELARASGARTDAVVIVPAFPDAGRVTIGGTHYMRDGAGGLVPVAETEFAQDATFGFTRSRLAEYVEEKSGGRYPARDVLVLDLNVIRGGAGAIADALDGATGGVPAVADIVTENDLRALALGLAEAERRGKVLLYRVGPPFVRGRIGQEVRAPLTAGEAFAGRSPAPGGGLVVIGSHVGLTTRQFDVLRAEHPCARVVELGVEKLLDGAAEEIDAVVGDVVAGLADGEVVLHTSRVLVRADTPEESLRIARTVSAALVEVVRRTLAEHPPRFVVAKGGITSSDVASEGLQIRHAIVRGPMLPGIVSLWEPVGGPAAGIPYVVFPGNVGDDRSLLDVVRVLAGA